jgi:RHS repeat-associated protein
VPGLRRRGGALTHLADFARSSYYFEYDAAGRRTVKQLPNGAVVYYAYDAASRLTEVLNRKADLSVISSLYYEYDDRALPAWQHRRGDFDVSHDYVYDPVPRLALERIKDPDGNILYAFSYYYDGNGRRTQLYRPDQGDTYYSYDADDRLLRADYPDDSSAYYVYDADGNTTEVHCPTGGQAGPEGVTYYSFDADNLMVEATVPGVATPNGFRWNADVQRVRRTSSDGELVELRDGQKLIAERTPGGVYTARYANEGESLYSWLLGDLRGASSRWATFDHLGTVQGFLDADADVLGSDLREAYGTQLGSTGSQGGPFGYVGALGYYRDADLGALLLSRRHYVAGLGQFLSRDPVQGEPAYGYVRGLPGSAVDPTGRSWWSTVWDVLTGRLFPTWYNCCGEMTYGAYGWSAAHMVAYLHLSCRYECGCYAWDCDFYAEMTSKAGAFGTGGAAALYAVDCLLDIYAHCPTSPPGRPVHVGDTVGIGSSLGLIAGLVTLKGPGPRNMYCLGLGGVGGVFSGGGDLFVTRTDWHCRKTVYGSFDAFTPPFA